MKSNKGSKPQSQGGLSRVTCPQCFTKFRPEDVLWVSEHRDLFGQDSKVANAQLRFLPSRFAPNGLAIDPGGLPCHRVACPNCHLEIPRALLELSPFFLSILGAPGSGKSYFLAAMASQLRKTLPHSFQTSFADADAELNTRLKQSESGLFANARPDQAQGLHELVDKTQEQGDAYGYESVNFGSQSVQFLRPCAFTMQLQENHPNIEQRGFGKTICLYDNAGESFLPGSESATSPVTRHLAESSMLFFLFDPLQDSRFRALAPKELEQGLVDKSHLGAQEAVFQEAAKRIRTFAGLSVRDKYPRRVIVIVTKCDRWIHLATKQIATPYPVWSSNTEGANASVEQQNAFDIGMVDTVSKKVRKLLMSTTPEVVSAVENFSNKVTFVPVSATGGKIYVDKSSGLQHIRPGDAQPFWAEVPFLYALASSSMGLIPRTTTKPNAAPVKARQSG